MRIHYDTEFIEDGKTIDLVSIGMINELGETYYAVSSEFNVSRLLASDWLYQNVWSSLPQRSTVWERDSYVRLELDDGHEDVWSRATIAEGVLEFVQRYPKPELWAWYGAYDHVVLCQLFGRMIDLPDKFPMWTNDLKQEVTRLEQRFGCAINLPKQLDGHHNALADAKHLKARHSFLEQWVKNMEITK